MPARAPNHNAECEQFQGTMVQECRHPDFHRHFSSVRRLQAEADARLTTYTTAGATTATTCVDIPLTRFSTTTSETRQHDTTGSIRRFDSRSENTSDGQNHRRDHLDRGNSDGNSLRHTYGINILCRQPLCVCRQPLCVLSEVGSAEPFDVCFLRWARPGNSSQAHDCESIGDAKRILGVLFDE